MGQDDGYRRHLHDTAMELARAQIAKSQAGKDADIIQAVKALGDVNEAYNVISGRIVEWYGIHFPGQHKEQGELIDFIMGAGEGLSQLSDEDADALQGLSATAKVLSEERKCLERYISQGMGEIAPNLSKIIGPVLGARLIARAGGLDKLAKMPASSIQVMGAGEALFKHLKSGTPSPKHGLIFKHPLISGAPKKARGKISRMLAGKAAIAARVDYYSGEPVDLGDLKKAAAAKGRSKAGKGP